MKQSSDRSAIINKINIQQCKVHKAANQVGQPNSINPKCKCCHLPCKKRQLNFWFSQKEVFYLGPGVVLFFRFIIICFITVLIPMLIFSIAATIININSQPTVDLNYSRSWIMKLSTFNTISNFNQVTSFLLGGSAVLLLIMVPLCVRFSLKVIEKLYSPQNNYFYPQQLAILIKLQRAANYSQEVVIKTLNQWFEIQLKIASKQVASEFNVIQNVFFHFNYQLYEQIIKQIDEYEALKNQQQFVYSFEINNKENSQKQSLRYSTKKSQKSIEVKINKAEILKQKLRNKQLQKTNKMIIVLKSFQYVQLIKQRTKSSYCRNNLNKLIFPRQNYAKVFDAPFPSQIQFKHQHISYSQQKKCIRIISWIVTIFCILVGTALQYGLLMLYQKLQFLKNFEFGCIVIAAIIYVISQILVFVSKILVQKQYQSTKTQKDCSESSHIILTNVFLKCLSILLVFYLCGFPLYSNKGIIEVTTWFIIIWGSNIIIKRFINLSTVLYLIQTFTSQDEIKKMRINQKETNKLFESPQNKINITYAQMVSFILSNFAFCSFSPVNLFICAGTLFLSFFAQKICFVDIYKQPHPSNQSLFIHISNLLWKSPVFLIIGHMYTICVFQALNYPINNTVKVLFYVLLAIFIIVTFLPSSLLKIHMRCELAYYQIKQKMINGYQDFNPLYMSNLPIEIMPPKSALRTIITKSDVLIEQLNTMSKSLQVTLRQRLFNQKNPCIEQFGNRFEDDSMYFQFDNKVSMPQNKPKKGKNILIPPIFKPSKKDVSLKNTEQKYKKQKQLVKLSHLATEEQQQIKNKIKEAIRGQINKLK